MLLIFLTFLFQITTTIAAPPLRPINLTSFANKRVLIITAHPDDAEGFSGGLISALQQRKDVHVSYLIITSGNAGGKCYQQVSNSTFYFCEKEEIAYIRRKESIAAGAFLGVENVWRVGLDDGMSVSYHETRVRRAITTYVRYYQPHVVLTHSPYPDWNAPPTCNGLCLPPKNWDDLGYHPDHQHVGSIVYNSLYGSGSSVDNNLLFEDIQVGGNLPKWKIEQLYFFALTKETMTHYFELNADLLNNKVLASSMHRSQYQGEKPLDTFQWVAEQVGEVCNVSLAEGYQGWF